MLTETLTYFGPVVAIGPAIDGRLKVRLPAGDVVTATMALAVPYQPAAGDELLCASDYVIGVIKTAGVATIRYSGDVRIESEGTVTIRARRLIERVSDAFVWVANLFQVKARRLRSVATGELLMKSNRAHFKSDADFSINGRTIHLG
jgi:hypothetical protein